jgi:UDP-glucose 4-epimerase
MNTQKNALVTGGAGFIGGHVVDRLLQDKWNVTVIDDFSLGSREQIASYGNQIRFFEKSITEDLSDIFRDTKYDAIFHIAALPRVQFSIKDPLATHNANINGTLNLLLAARDAGVKRFVFSSSSSIYGDQKILPLTEDMKPNPLSPYALHKLTGEYYCQFFHSLYGMETVSLRYFNVYGPRQNPNGEYAAAIARFSHQIIHDDSPIIFGDGEQTRDFTFVSDVAEANFLAATAANEKVFGDAFNIGGGIQISVNEIVSRINIILKKNIVAQHVAPVVESRHTKADISHTKQVLGWEPKVSFDEGLELVVNSLK